MRPLPTLFYNLRMHNNDDMLPSDDEEEVGSDELLAADELRLPPGANILVRLHAMRAWLNRRYDESGLEVGMAALELQEVTRGVENEARPRRRFAQNDSAIQRAQRRLADTQERQHAYDEARALLEDCVAHTTTGDRLLVEYYLSLEEHVLSPDSPTSTPWLEAMQDVLHRVEQVGTPGEAEDE